MEKQLHAVLSVMTCSR